MTAKEFIDSKEWTQNTVHFSISDVVDLMQEYARIKCLEAIKNVRHRSYDLVGYRVTGDQQIDKILQEIQRDIQNIPDQDVMPEL